MSEVLKSAELRELSKDGQSGRVKWRVLRDKIVFDLDGTYFAVPFQDMDDFTSAVSVARYTARHA